MTARDRAWLTAAADRLDAQGHHELALQTRAEAAAPDAPTALPPVLRCDLCRVVVRDSTRIDAYGELGVDWVLCARCERSE